MDIITDFSDVDKAFEEMEEEIRGREIQAGEEAVRYAVENGSYQNRTGNLRASNGYKIEKDGLALTNSAEYASYVESKGYEVLESAALYAEKLLNE